MKRILLMIFLVLAVLGAVGGLFEVAALRSSSNTVQGVGEWSQAVNLLMGFLGAIGAYLMLRVLDFLNGTKFSEHMAIIDDTPLSLAIYRGIRFAAVLLFVALLLK